MYYSINFKKAVVKKAVSNGIELAELSRRLNVNRSTISRWKKQFGHEFKEEEVNIDHLVDEKEIDIDELLQAPDATERSSVAEVEEEKLTADEIFRKRKGAERYTETEKYVIISTFRNLDENEQGLWLRRNGLYSGQINQWEDELLLMGRKKIIKDEYTKKLEKEKKELEKKLRKAEKENNELKILIELKKKYPTLFETNVDKEDE